MEKFIPKSYSSEQISIRLDVTLIKQLDEYAGQYNMSRNALIGQCIRYAIDHMEPPADKPH